ncbi:hypothetical protein D3C80_966930 [compost metagenome]
MLVLRMDQCRNTDRSPAITYLDTGCTQHPVNGLGYLTTQTSLEAPVKRTRTLRVDHGWEVIGVDTVFQRLADKRHRGTVLER